MSINYTAPPYPRIFIYWGSGTVNGGRNDVLVMFQKNFYEYHQWTTFSQLDASLRFGDAIVFPGCNPGQVGDELQTVNGMTAEQVRDKIQSYTDAYMHLIFISSGGYLPTEPYNAFDYFGIFDYSGDRDGTGNIGRVTLNIDPTYLYPNGGQDLLFTEAPVFYQTLPSNYDIIATYQTIPPSGFNGVNAGNVVGTPAILYNENTPQLGAVLIVNVQFEKGNGPKTAYKQFFKLFEDLIVSKNII